MASRQNPPSTGKTQNVPRTSSTRLEAASEQTLGRQVVQALGGALLIATPFIVLALAL